VRNPGSLLFVGARWLMSHSWIWATAAEEGGGRHRARWDWVLDTAPTSPPAERILSLSVSEPPLPFLSSPPPTDAASTFPPAILSSLFFWGANCDFFLY
jgi:hypothetical protein